MVPLGLGTGLAGSRGCAAFAGRNEQEYIGAAGSNEEIALTRRSEGTNTAKVSAKARIGVIGHNESTRLAIEGLLRAGGYEVQVFTTPEDFLSSGQVEQLDCLLLNSADKPAGFRELAQHLQDLNAAVPIILFSSQAGAAQPEDLYDHGVVAYLTSPVEWETLRLAISMAMKGKPQGKPGNEG